MIPTPAPNPLVVTILERRRLWWENLQIKTLNKRVNILPLLDLRKLRPELVVQGDSFPSFLYCTKVYIIIEPIFWPKFKVKPYHL